MFAFLKKYALLWFWLSLLFFCLHLFSYWLIDIKWIWDVETSEVNHQRFYTLRAIQLYTISIGPVLAIISLIQNSNFLVRLLSFLMGVTPFLILFYFKIIWIILLS